MASDDLAAPLMIFHYNTVSLWIEKQWKIKRNLDTVLNTLGVPGIESFLCCRLKNKSVITNTVIREKIKPTIGDNEQTTVHWNTVNIG